MPDYYVETVRTYTVTRRWKVCDAPDEEYAKGAATSVEQNETDDLSMMDVGELLFGAVEEYDQSAYAQMGHDVTEITLVHPAGYRVG